MKGNRKGEREQRIGREEEGGSQEEAKEEIRAGAPGPGSRVQGGWGHCAPAGPPPCHS